VNLHVIVSPDGEILVSVRALSGPGRDLIAAQIPGLLPLAPPK
jgi:hypothetical protein